MKKTLSFVLLAGCLVMVGEMASLPAAFAGEELFLIAQAHRTNVEDRIEEQQRRIDNGILNGNLSRSEADVLMDNLNWIRRRYHQLRSDGMLTHREAQNLQKMLDNNSQMIYKSKHNRIRRLY